MTKFKSSCLVACLMASTALVSTPVLSQEVTAEDLSKFQEELQKQQAELKRQQEELDKQRQELSAQQLQLQNLMNQMQTQVQTNQQVATDRREPALPATPPPIQQADNQPRSVGEAPDRSAEANQDISVIADVGGVLTPKGQWVIEPSVEYTHASDNRFFFQGVEIVDAVLVGLIEAQDFNRDVINGSLGVRYGITNRLEADARVSFQKRQDKLASTPVSSTETTVLTDLDGSGLGDVEFGLHYQINRKRGKWPYAVANLRVKSDTGDGPFDVSRNAQGIETELPTGSGFWTVEPSVTLIYPTDPAVLFANVGYLFNIEDDVNTQLTDTTFIRKVDPGDAIKASFGMGLGINERLSMSFGYDHSYIFGTKTEIGIREARDFTSSVFDPNAPRPFTFVNTEGRTAQVGQFLWGVSYILTDRVNINFNVGVGVTSDAPDARVMLRVPIKLGGG